MAALAVKPTSCIGEQTVAIPLTTCSMNGDQRVCSVCPTRLQRRRQPRLCAFASHVAGIERRIHACAHAGRHPVSSDCPTAHAARDADSRGAPRIAHQNRRRADGERRGLGFARARARHPTGQAGGDVAMYGVSSQYDGVSVERTGIQDAYLKARMPSVEDAFGWGLAISGDTLVVGAIYEDSAAGGVNGDQSNGSAADSGAAYMYSFARGDAWVQQAYLKAIHRPRSRFLPASAWRSPGDTIAVGAVRADPWHGASGVTPRSGRVYVFTRQNGVWSQQARARTRSQRRLTTWSARMSRCKAISLVFGAANDSSSASQSGAAYVYLPHGRHGGPRGPNSRRSSRLRMTLFGSSMLRSTRTFYAADQRATADSTDADSAGSADVFVLRDGSWVEQQQLRPSMPSDHGVFGESVAVRGRQPGGRCTPLGSHPVAAARGGVLHIRTRGRQMDGYGHHDRNPCRARTTTSARAWG